MYERFYGLQERPFDLVPNPRYLFLTPYQREALSNLRFGLTTPRGLTLLLGDAGTGKTTLVQASLAELKDHRVRCVVISNTTLTRQEFYEFLASGFHLDAAAAASKTQFLFQLRRSLQEQTAGGVLNALIIDEAQSLSHELLEEVRLLSNIETTTTKLLNVVLAGQPELAQRLNERSLRQLKQRISLRCELRAMDLTETASYIAGRIRIAGGRPERLFTQEAVAAIYAASRGIPRMVNVICDNALIGGFAAAVSPITSGFVTDVCRDFDIHTQAGDAPSPPARESSEESTGSEQAVDVQTRPPLEGPAAPLFEMYSRPRRFSFF